MYADQSPLITLSAADRRIRKLGDTMFERNAKGDCTRGLLRAEGFSDHEIDTYGDAARAHANSRFVRKTEGFTRTDEEIIEIAVEASAGLVGDAQIVSAALTRGLRPGDIARNWNKITVKLAAHVARLPMPRVA